MMKSHEYIFPPCYEQITDDRGCLKFGEYNWIQFDLENLYVKYSSMNRRNITMNIKVLTMKLTSKNYLESGKN